MDHLAALVDKSLVLTEESRGSTRYRLLETVRAYAAERLAQRPGSDRDETRAAHRDHYLALVRPPASIGAAASRPSAGPAGGRSTTSARPWRSASPIPVARARAAPPAGLRWFCQLRGHSGEVLEALELLLDRPDAGLPTRGPGPGPDRKVPPAQSLRRRLGNPGRWPARPLRSPATSPMPPSPPMPCPRRAGSCWSVAICRPRWLRSTKRSRWPYHRRSPADR